MTQLHQIQAHLLSGQPIDKVTAYRLFGHTHVSSAISKLRKIGMEIHQRSTYQVNGMGKKVLCNEYFVKVKMEGREWKNEGGELVTAMCNDAQEGKVGVPVQ